ncbi:sensor histidine kinase [Nitrososphaera viennensis]|nr:ATP-binding protein [Nitrososphaera viennensis]UVS68330.1 HAMP domain-containing histidine kinase [Nitrososphaera viennensis]
MTTETPATGSINNSLGSSLHTKIVLLIMAIALVSIVVLAAISIENGQQILKKDVGQRLNVIASDRMQAIKSVWNLRLEQADVLASDPKVQTFLASIYAPTSGAKDAAVQAISEFDRLTRTKDTTYLAVRIADAGGNILVSTEKSGNEKAALSQEMIRRASIAPFYTITFDKELQIALLETVAPVHRPADSGSAPIGFVSIVREPQTANSILTNKLFLGDTGELYLVSENGLMITDSRFASDARYRQTIEAPPVQQCFDNGADVVGALYTNYRGATVFGASNCDKNLGAVLVSEVERDEMFSPLRVLQYEFLSIAGVIIAAAGASAFFLSQSILKPLQRLRMTMRKVQAGDFEKVDIARRDEIGELAASFNAMVEEIGIKTKKIHLKNDILSFMASRLEVQADELKKIDREKEEYASVVAHELKTFLVPIIGYSELLLDGTFGKLEQIQKEKVLIMLERAWSLLYLTQNVLDARLLETKALKMNIAKEPVSAMTLLKECKERALPLARSRNLKIVVTGDVNDDNDNHDDGAKQLMLYCDSQKVLQVLDNLVNNAIKATSPGSKNGAIRLRAEKMYGDEVLFSVKDSGRGIPPEMQPHLLRKFYELDKSLTRQAGGSGLGLAISRGIVEAHGGRIWFDSIPDVGSSFYFTIPMTPDTKANPNKIL